MILSLKNLSINYEKKNILNVISLELEKASSLTILGANGSGKSSLAKAIAGLIDYEGTVYLNADDSSTLSVKEKAKRVAYIPAKLDAFELQVSVEEFVLMGRYAHKERFSNYTSEDFSKVADILKKLSLSSLQEQQLSTLSSGEQQLVLIAQALVQESPLLIFDEPTSHLDPQNVVKFVKLYKELQQSHSTILITHDIHLAQSIKQSVLFIGECKAYLYKENFFTQETLFKHYKVNFSSSTNSLGVNFD
jgi:iron complex transport system ATP-binding protein